MESSKSSSATARSAPTDTRTRTGTVMGAPRMRWMRAWLALAAVVPVVAATAPTPAPSAPTAKPTLYPTHDGCSVESYYSGVREHFDKLEGLALQKLLHNLISGHTIVPYTSTKTDAWDALEVLDADPTNDENVKVRRRTPPRQPSLSGKVPPAPGRPHSPTTL